MLFATLPATLQDVMAVRHNLLQPCNSRFMGGIESMPGLPYLTRLRFEWHTSIPVGL
jgi:hypothetical protein